MSSLNEKDDLTFMMRTPLWPLWPCLPMKRYQDSEGRSNMDVGVLWSLDFDSHKFMWFEGLAVWDVEKMKAVKTEDGKPLNRDELHTLIDEGWMVD